MVGMIIVQAVRAEEVVTGLGKLWIKLEEQQGTSQQFFEPEETLLPENSKELREQCADVPLICEQAYAPIAYEGGRDPIEKVGTPVSHDRNTPSLICQRQSMIPGKVLWKPLILNSSFTLPSLGICTKIHLRSGLWTRRKARIRKNCLTLLRLLVQIPRMILSSRTADKSLPSRFTSV
ncbi:hypothetical protein M9H77_29465 [Catharanthus roseus]|uniref:Uncharacterized protein n=1 Tax=Catharanthus roseus TaxID=4058 RepID=A0ACB9ZWN8_CATRO|nr:hypothetical protein M9H77_29465 [Catharanthus roseus]